METVNRNTLAGAVTLWKLVRNATNYDQLSSKFAEAGFPNILPSPMKPRAALRKALEDTYYAFKGERDEDTPITFDVVAVKGDGINFEVIRISKIEGEEKRNNYEHILTATINDEKQVLVDGGIVHEELTERYRHNLSLVPHAALAVALVKIVERLGGLALRPNGGVYWIPNTVWETWSMVAKAVESSSNGNRIYALRSIMDENAIVAVREALAEEIATEAAVISKALADPETAIKTATRLKGRAEQLQEKISAYEKSLSVVMADLHSALTEASQTVAVSTVLESASSGSILSAGGLSIS